ncbi:hypothetical protein DFP91_0571 [Pseudorhodoplanes sinuspersici]|nr:hypothetical protein DFP91_0571 [Pseudorhodoplanes sinuspersici]
MLRKLTRTMRLKAAAFVAVLYALTVLAPHAAIAFSGPNGMPHCFSGQMSVSAHQHGASQTTHPHADGKAHSHEDPSRSSDSSEDKGPPASCCGLFSCSAIIQEPREFLPASARASSVALVLPDLVHGQGPDRINRPPIA